GARSSSGPGAFHVSGGNAACAGEYSGRPARPGPVPAQEDGGRWTNEPVMAAENGRRARMAPVRHGALEPYTALRWVSTLFKGAAVFLAVAVVAETIAGLTAMGFRVLPQLLGEVVRTAVFAVVLWGAGDLVRLLIHLGHDIRAERILLTRI